MWENNGNRAGKGVALLVFLMLGRGVAEAQAVKGPGKLLTLEEAIDFAVANYPSVRAAEERILAARAGVDLAKTNYLPRTDMLWQSNRATRNNIFGLLLPQSVVPSISGPVLPSTSDTSVWGSAAGVLFSWEPMDFGYRRATLRVAEAGQTRATAEVSLTRLEVALAAAEAYFALLTAQERVRAAQADVERRKVLADALRVLVENQLRPGADASRADAELAVARTRLIEAEAAEQADRAALATILGIAGSEVKIEPGPLMTLSPDLPLPAVRPDAHPFATVEKARVEEASARVRTVERSYFPRINFQSGVAGRGTGANTDGTVARGLNGLGLERANWAAGLTVSFPLFDFASVRARKQIEAANERAEEARYRQVIQDLTGQSAQARALWEGARRVAENTPIELRAARDTEAQASARYKAGLATIVDVADAQRLLVQAEIEDALARVNIWHALLRMAATQGDLQPFLGMLRTKTRGGP